MVKALAPRAILPVSALSLLPETPWIPVPAEHDGRAAQVVASSAAASRGCADLVGHFGHLLTSSPAAAVPEQAPPAATQKLAVAAALLQRLLGKRAATDAGIATAQTSSWRV